MRHGDARVTEPCYVDAGDDKEKLMLTYLLTFITLLHARLSLAVCRLYGCIIHTVQRAEVVREAGVLHAAETCFDQSKKW